jgi:hypothetical protein
MVPIWAYSLFFPYILEQKRKQKCHMAVVIYWQPFLEKEISLIQKAIKGKTHEIALSRDTCYRIWSSLFLLSR